MVASVQDNRFDPAVLRTRWVQAPADDADRLARVREATGVDFSTAGGRVWETDNFVYLPVVVNVASGETVTREAVVFALGGDRLITLQPRAHFEIFDKAIARMRRSPYLTQTTHGVMYALLYALNEAAERAIDYASDALEDMTNEIQLAANGYDERGKEIGVSDIQGTIVHMNNVEEIVSRSQESQILLVRAARYLRSEVSPSEVVLSKMLDILIADIDGVKEHASFEHDKVRYLQQSIMTSLEMKQNQIVKIFTIITAVFLPPTLIATFYGMNFTNMPELSWNHGFLATTLLTLVTALIPLGYIKKKGWLR